MFTVYFDASGTRRNEALTMAGCIGYQEVGEV
jgi:hypothetical protein